MVRLGTIVFSTYPKHQIGKKQNTEGTRGIARRGLEAPAQHISSELNVNGCLFKRSNSLLDKGQLFKGKNLIL